MSLILESPLRSTSDLCSHDLYKNPFLNRSPWSAAWGGKESSGLSLPSSPQGPHLILTRWRCDDLEWSSSACILHGQMPAMTALVPVAVHLMKCIVFHVPTFCKLDTLTQHLFYLPMMDTLCSGWLNKMLESPCLGLQPPPHPPTSLGGVVFRVCFSNSDQPTQSPQTQLPPLSGFHTLACHPPALTTSHQTTGDSPHDPEPTKGPHQANPKPACPDSPIPTQGNRNKASGPWFPCGPWLTLVLPCVTSPRPMAHPLGNYE